MLNAQDDMLNVQDNMLNAHDIMLNAHDNMSNAHDNMLNVQDNMLGWDSRFKHHLSDFYFISKFESLPNDLCVGENVKTIFY